MYGVDACVFVVCVGGGGVGGTTKQHDCVCMTIRQQECVCIYVNIPSLVSVLSTATCISPLSFILPTYRVYHVWVSHTW